MFFSSVWDIEEMLKLGHPDNTGDGQGGYSAGGK